MIFGVSIGISIGISIGMRTLLYDKSLRGAGFYLQEAAGEELILSILQKYRSSAPGGCGPTASLTLKPNKKLSNTPRYAPSTKA